MSDKGDLLEILLKAGLEIIIGAILRNFFLFAVVGLNGAGKSSLINALSNNVNLCEVSSEGESKTQKL